MMDLYHFPGSVWRTPDQEVLGFDVAYSSILNKEVMESA